MAVWLVLFGIWSGMRQMVFWVLAAAEMCRLGGRGRGDASGSLSMGNVRHIA